MAGKDETAPHSLKTTEQQYAIKSWRYLRVAMVLLVLGLGVAIGFELREVSARCVKTSISAYYYTPVQHYFVAALFGIGVCLFCLRGHTDIEDGLLNLAGMLAPIVALVPTPDQGECAASVAPSVAGSLKHQAANIENNVTTLIALGLLAGLVLIVLTLRQEWKRRRQSPPAEPPPASVRPSRTACVMYGLAVVVWIALMLGFWVMPDDDFTQHAHDIAAGSMFFCIFLVVCLNASGYKTDKAKKVTLLPNPYVAIYLAMGVSVVIAAAARRAGSDYWVLYIEVALISLFAVFWYIQTIEFWDDGLRSRTSSSDRGRSD